MRTSILFSTNSTHIVHFSSSRILQRLFRIASSVQHKMEGRLRRKRPRTHATCRQMNKKQQSQKQPNYEPPEGHTMSKEELSAWRKNQRRLRNRQVSAIFWHLIESWIDRCLQHKLITYGESSKGGGHWTWGLDTR